MYVSPGGGLGSLDQFVGRNNKVKSIYDDVFWAVFDVFFRTSRSYDSISHFKAI